MIEEIQASITYDGPWGSKPCENLFLKKCGDVSPSLLDKAIASNYLDT